MVWCTLDREPQTKWAASDIFLILQVSLQIADRCFHIGMRLLGRLFAKLCLAIMRNEEVDSFGVANAVNVPDNLEAQLQHMLNNAKRVASRSTHCDDHPVFNLSWWSIACSFRIALYAGQT